ncbi:hypothetical protein H2199_006349 [Coniosporium tulheliwenetii]|uniref:Uncharacterized protein n=1 Tax=Coniosporium tulheliwenetii TaxID=3383036 RepID=A0ACC2YVH8_9PEZI|nr:hypothetical protein H2199_006349 [Cladosporium sp. JES 115]
MGDSKPHPSELLEFATPAFANDVHLELITTPTAADGHGAPGTPAEGNNDGTQSSDDLFSALSHAVPGLSHLATEAKSAAQTEHRMSFMEGLKLYPKAIGWSILFSLTIVMEAYDTALVNSFYAFPEFRRSYGRPTGNESFEIPTAWQSGLINGARSAEILGLLGQGYLADGFGYRKTMMVSLAAMSLFIFLAFFAVNIGMLLASQVLCGLSWGVFQTLSTTYAAEVVPVALRAYLTSTVNLCWLIGQLISVGVVRAFINNTSEWSYRIPFGLQWMWAIPILIGVAFAPESPWWLIRHDRPGDAKKSLLRLTRRAVDFNAHETVSMMKHTNQVEKYHNGGTSYWDCFKGTDLRRTEIAAAVWITQAWSGSALTGYAAYFYVQAGLTPERAFDLSTGMYGLAILGGIMAMFIMRVVGRRTLYIWGLSGCFITLLVTGGVSTRPESPAVSWTLGSLVLLLTFIYDITIGPVCFALVAEIPSTRLRVKTVVLARVAYNIVSIISNVLMPKMLNPTAWDWGVRRLFCGREPVLSA